MAKNGIAVKQVHMLDHQNGDELEGGKRAGFDNDSRRETRRS